MFGVRARAANLRGSREIVAANRYGIGRSDMRAVKEFTGTYQRSRKRPSAAPRIVVSKIPALYQMAMKVGVLSVQ